MRLWRILDYWDSFFGGGWETGEGRREGSELFSFFLLFSFSFRAKELIGKSRSCKERGC